MEIFPPLQLGILNGWLLFAVFFLTFGIIRWLFPKEVVDRLYDRSGWSADLQRVARFVKVFALVALLYSFFVPLKIGEPIFVAGIVVYGLGFVGFVWALFTYKNTPLDEPVTGGLYKVSRNPQWASMLLIVLGVCLAIGSWTAVILYIFIAIFGHYRILAEEAGCLSQYGDSYQEYMDDVPRYFLVV